MSLLRRTSADPTGWAPSQSIHAPHNLPPHRILAFRCIGNGNASIDPSGSLSIPGQLRNPPGLGCRKFMRTPSRSVLIRVLGIRGGRQELASCGLVAGEFYGNPTSARIFRFTRRMHPVIIITDDWGFGGVRWIRPDPSFGFSNGDDSEEAADAVRQLLDLCPNLLEFGTILHTSTFLWTGGQPYGAVIMEAFTSSKSPLKRLHFTVPSTGRRGLGVSPTGSLDGVADAIDNNLNPLQILNQ